jgi:non-ribosomal peptide synthetase component E (peptide arylation enzyme)
MENLSLTGLLKRAASDFPTRRALSVSGKFDLTHARLHELVDHAASLLLAAGISPGDVVALTFPNTVEVHFFFFSLIFLPTNTATKIVVMADCYESFCSLWWRFWP